MVAQACLAVALEADGPELLSVIQFIKLWSDMVSSAPFGSRTCTALYRLLEQIIVHRLEGYYGDRVSTATVQHISRRQLICYSIEMFWLIIGAVILTTSFV